MTRPVTPETVPAHHESGPVATLNAEPESIELPLQRTALIVVDMQHGYASPGGYRDLAGKDVGPAAMVIDRVGDVLAAARHAGITRIFLQNGWDARGMNTGGPTGPLWYKSNPLKLMRARPELHGRILTHGSWDYEFVESLAPQPDEFVVPKSRYSGFCGTDLDSILRNRDIRHLLFVGIATNVCVESTIREAFHRDYFSVLVGDAAQASGPAYMHDATVYNVRTFLGWVSDTKSVCQALGFDGPAPLAGEHSSTHPTQEKRS